MSSTQIAARSEDTFRADLVGDFTVKAKNWGLKQVPEEIVQKKSARVILLSRNLLEVIPADFGKISTLSVLKVEHNKIKYLPKELGELKCLTEIQAAHNLINSLPVELARIKSLKKLGLSGNPMMDELGSSGKALWEVWYGEVAGPRPKTEAECIERPQQSSGTNKTRTSLILDILRRYGRENVPEVLQIQGASDKERADQLCDDSLPRGSTSLGVADEGPRTEDSLGTEVHDLGGTLLSTPKTACSGIGSATYREAAAPLGSAMEEGRNGTWTSLDPVCIKSSGLPKQKSPYRDHSYGTLKKPTDEQETRSQVCGQQSDGARGSRKKWRKYLLMGGAIIGCAAFMIRR